MTLHDWYLAAISVFMLGLFPFGGKAGCVAGHTLRIALLFGACACALHSSATWESGFKICIGFGVIVRLDIITNQLGRRRWRGKPRNRTMDGS